MEVFVNEVFKKRISPDSKKKTQKQINPKFRKERINEEKTIIVDLYEDKLRVCMSLLLIVLLM